MKIILFLTFLIFLARTSKIDVSSLANIDQLHQTHLNLNFTVDFDHQQIFGSNEITLKRISSEPLTEVVLDALDLTINTIIDSSGNNLPFSSKGSENKFLGRGVSIDVSSLKVPVGGTFKLKLAFETPRLQGSGAVDHNSITSAILWLDKEATTSGEPFFFTQCEATLCRTIFPCQDTPAVKTTFEVYLKIKKPLRGLASGLLVSRWEDEHFVKFHYIQQNKVPTYLIALAGGKIEELRIGSRTAVFAEAAIVKDAKNCFENLESYVDKVAEYIGSYDWTEYNILVLPPGFPFGGMENPSLTFASPTIVTGNKSLNNVAIHEIAHSWTGNTVTNLNWSHFWLNEGFTVFLERKGLAEVFGVLEMQFQEALGWNALKRAVSGLGEDNDLTKLITNMEGKNPDDCTTVIPYEKGYFFLRHLELLVDGSEEGAPSLFKVLLRDWIAFNKWKSVETEDFKNHFDTWVRSYLPDKAEFILSKADFYGRTTTPGMPPGEEPSNKRLEFVKERVSRFSTPEIVYPSFFYFTTSEVVYFFLKLSEIKGKEEEMKGLFLRIFNEYEIETKNAEIKSNFYLWALQNKYTEVIEQVVNFLGTTGRMKYLVPLYKSLNEMNHLKAVETLKKNSKMYHSLAVQRIEAILKIETENIE